MTKRPEHDPLEELFDAARDARPGGLPEPLFARIMADAERVDRARHRRPAAPSARAGWLAASVAALGGWPAAAGLATAAMAGVWIGAAQPEGLLPVGGSTAFATDAPYDLGDLMPGFDALVGEG